MTKSDLVWSGLMSGSALCLALLIEGCQPTIAQSESDQVMGAAYQDVQPSIVFTVRQTPSLWISADPLIPELSE